MADAATLDFVTALGVQWLRRPVQDAPALQALLATPALDEAQRATVVEAVSDAVADERAAHGYQSQDLVVLHPGTPGLDDALQRFDKPHVHSDDEVRYILDGEGLFGFFDATGAERVVQVQAGDYLRVPAGVEHRFTLTDTRRIKALRLFTGADGWAARYTGRSAGALAPAA